MDLRAFRRIRVLAVSLTTVTATTTLFAIAGAAGPASAASTNGCPASKTLASLKTADNLTAGFSTDSAKVTTYTFASSTAEPPISPGVPGLMKYCVYPSPASQPSATEALAKGADGTPWNEGAGSNNFAFVRPGGDKTNIELNGTSTTMGTATWSAVPTDQTIILHINDPTVCHDLYGGTSLTCFVKPGGPICNLGDTSVAYNAMPFGVVNCLNPAIGFEATQTSEFGDGVQLAGTARTLVSLNVLFMSYACQSGHWNTGDCVSAPDATFDWPITANIYAVDNSGSTPAPGALLATETVSQTIPFRPSADPSCPAGGDAPAGAQWFNPLAPNGGHCQNSIGKVLTFGNMTAPGGGAVAPLPDEVIWTVAFNTQHYGNPPAGITAICTLTGGCPYDSLNVGDKSYPGAPYAGTDTDPNGAFLSSTWSGAYCDNGAAGTGFLRLDTGTIAKPDCWNAFKPLGEIITK